MSNKNSAPMPRRPSTLLDLDAFVPFFIGAIANRWTASSSKLYLETFGFGITEWRVLGILGSKEFGRDEAGASSAQMVYHLGVDAGALSRAVANLERLKMIERVPGKFPGRTKPYRMTGSGVETFEKIREVAMQRQELLLGNLTDEERKFLLALLRKVHERLPAISRP